MTEKDKTYELILKHLNNEISKKEQILLKKELSNDRQLKKSFTSLSNFWENFFPKPISHSIIKKTEKKLGFTYRLGSATKNRTWLTIAATLLLIVSLSFSVFQTFKPKQNLTLNEYGCGASEVKEIILSDGTKVWLNSSSLLIASEPFVGDTRSVKLFGEAYFEVAHNEEQPFEVQTRNLKTKVLGTHLNVVAYPTDEIHEISLYQGKVQVNSDIKINENHTLNPGDRAYITIKTGKIEIVHTDLGKEAQWRDGILRFYDENLFSISKKLERRFHSKIFIADSIIGKLKFSAEFEEETLEKIMKILSEAHDFAYKFTDSGVLLNSKN